MKKNGFLFGIVLLLFVVPVGVMAQSADDVAGGWWRDTVWYEVFVRSFYDSDGDGIGDLQGLIQKLDYLNDGNPDTTDDLGITGIWLMPIFDAASYHGYDTIDYRRIHPDFGTNDDFLQLMEEAHQRGIRVIVDLVPNHTSDQHPWFIASAARDPEFDDWYVWEDTNPNFAGPWGAPAWHQRGGRWYYGVFWSGMPDLNYDNPAVTAEMFDIARFWVEEMRADGFRLDAIKYIVERDGILQNSPDNRRWLANLNRYIKQFNPEAITVGEVFDTTQSVVRYINDDAVDLAFEFDLAGDILASVLARNNRNITRRYERGLRDYPFGRYAPFLTNHDQPRVMTQLNRSVEQNKVAATILLTTPGSPFLYYGEEIGMVGGKPDPRIRTPMHWTDDPVTAGFTTASQPYEPLSEDVDRANVAIQINDPDSLLSHYRDLIHLRNAHSVLRHGSMTVLDSSSNRLFAFLRQFEGETFLILINLNREAVDDYTLSLNRSEMIVFSSAEVLFGEMADFEVPVINENGGFDDYVPLPSLPPFAQWVVRLS